VDWTVARDPREAAEAAAAALVDGLRGALDLRGEASVALAGGSTPRAIYQIVAETGLATAIPWNRVSFYFGDERCVPPDHAESNFKLADDGLFSKVPIDRTRVFRPRAENPDLQAAARDYEMTLRALPGRLGDIPVLDMIMLGMGSDGHTASLFPGSPALGENSRLVVPAIGGPNRMQRLTFTLPLLNASRIVLFTATGAEKGDALRRVLDINDPDPVPAARVRPAGGQLRWILDEPLAAAAGL
jgi:6-phosphogluconolactonase